MLFKLQKIDCFIQVTAQPKISLFSTSSFHIENLDQMVAAKGIIYIKLGSGFSTATVEKISRVDKVSNLRL
jgi:hypothetical protein